LLRVFEGLQTADQNACALPANWKPGDSVIVPAPLTQLDAEKRVASNGSGQEVTDWYFTKKKLAAAAAD
jgi:peroxiredoxin (alkyl hydroperoxide reductase subunit C)